MIDLHNVRDNRLLDQIHRQDTVRNPMFVVQVVRIRQQNLVHLQEDHLRVLSTIAERENLRLVQDLILLHVGHLRALDLILQHADLVQVRDQVHRVDRNLVEA